MDILSKVDSDIAAATFPKIIKEESFILITAVKPNKEDLTYTIRFGGELFVIEGTNEPNRVRMAELMSKVGESILS